MTFSVFALDGTELHFYLIEWHKCSLRTYWPMCVKWQCQARSKYSVHAYVVTVISGTALVDPRLQRWTKNDPCPCLTPGSDFPSSPREVHVFEMWPKAVCALTPVFLLASGVGHHLHSSVGSQTWPGGSDLQDFARDWCGRVERLLSSPVSRSLLSKSFPDVYVLSVTQVCFCSYYAIWRLFTSFYLFTRFWALWESGFTLCRFVIPSSQCAIQKIVLN